MRSQVMIKRAIGGLLGIFSYSCSVLSFVRRRAHVPLFENAGFVTFLQHSMTLALFCGFECRSLSEAEKILLSLQPEIVEHARNENWPSTWVEVGKNEQKPDRV